MQVNKIPKLRNGSKRTGTWLSRLRVGRSDPTPSSSTGTSKYCVFVGIWFIAGLFELLVSQLPAFRMRLSPLLLGHS